MVDKSTIMSSYLGDLLHDPHEVGQRVISRIKQVGLDFEFIAVRGMSGALISGLVAAHFRKSISIVRKPKAVESSHGLRLEGTQVARDYIIIDDCIYTGATIRAILTGIGELAPESRCMGIFLYLPCGPDYEWEVEGGRNIPVYNASASCPSL